MSPILSAILRMSLIMALATFGNLFLVFVIYRGNFVSRQRISPVQVQNGNKSSHIHPIIPAPLASHLLGRFALRTPLDGLRDWHFADIPRLPCPRSRLPAGSIRASPSALCQPISACSDQHRQIPGDIHTPIPSMNLIFPPLFSRQFVARSSTTGVIDFAVPTVWAYPPGCWP
jgi:hypothetical protein